MISPNVANTSEAFVKLENMLAAPELLLLTGKCSRPASSQKFPHHLMPDATGLRLNSRLRMTLVLPSLALKRLIRSNDPALDAILAILFLGPPLETSPSSRPTSLTASLDAPFTRVASAEPPATTSASSKAPCGFICAGASFLHQMSVARGSFAPAANHSFNARRRRCGSVSTLFIKSRLASPKPSGLEINQACICMMVSSHPCPEASFVRPCFSMKGHSLAEWTSTSPPTELHSSNGPARNLGAI